MIWFTRGSALIFLVVAGPTNFLKLNLGGLASRADMLTTDVRNCWGIVEVVVATLNAAQEATNITSPNTRAFAFAAIAILID
mmetsp:Transcript_20061/g.33222  ORF Transcript_20061/g.33222 Transcript_20061/m.33222 type:complete len:82 (-) Transcript_20061:59-304(-)